MTTMIARGDTNMNKKKISITDKRQLTIPKNFYEELSFGKEAECILRGNEIVIRPIRDDIVDGNFDVEILEEILAEGYQNNEILIEFKKRQKAVKTAIEEMLDDVKRVAKGEIESFSYEDVFGEDE